MTWIQRSKGTVAGAIAGLLLLCAGPAAWAQAPKAERPTYAVGDKWIRSDGAYDLIRIENGRYVFAADGGREVHLTRDLGIAKIVRGGQALLELEPPPGLTWPLEVGQSGVSWLTLKSLDPQFGQSVVRLTWKVDAYQDVRVPAGTFKAFRIVQVLEPRFLAASPQSRRLELAFWYAPAIQQLVRADGNDLSGLAFQAVALDRPAAALAVALMDPKDQGRVATERITLTGKVTGGAGPLRIAVTLNGAEIARQQEAAAARQGRAAERAGEAHAGPEHADRDRHGRRRRQPPGRAGALLRQARARGGRGAGDAGRARAAHAAARERDAAARRRAAGPPHTGRAARDRDAGAPPPPAPAPSAPATQPPAAVPAPARPPVVAAPAPAPAPTAPAPAVRARTA